MFQYRFPSRYNSLLQLSFVPNNIPSSYYKFPCLNTLQLQALHKSSIRGLLEPGSIAAYIISGTSCNPPPGIEPNKYIAWGSSHRFHLDITKVIARAEEISQTACEEDFHCSLHFLYHFFFLRHHQYLLVAQSSPLPSHELLLSQWLVPGITKETRR